MVRKSKGRQKIEMVKMKNENNLQVTFSKRRAGLFKKASELCTLCGAEIGLIVFSPGRKVFSFGHPNVETVIDRFMNNNPPPPHQHGNIQPGDAHCNSVICELNDKLTKLVNGLEAEKKKHEELTKIRETSKMAQNWWEDAVEGFNLSQCKEFKGALENLKKSVAFEASKILQANPPHNFYIGSSSNAAGFGVDGGINHFIPDFDMFGPRTMLNNHNNMIIPGFDGASSNYVNHGFDGASSSHVNLDFGVDAGSSQTNPDFDMFDPRRIVKSQNMIVPNNPFINNPNTIVPHNTLQYGKNGNEGSVSDYNMNYGSGFNQNPSQTQLHVYNPNQNQSMMFKRENMSEYDEHHHGNPPHPGRDYY